MIEHNPSPIDIADDSTIKGSLFDSLMKNISDGIFIADQQGIIQSINPALQKLLGYNEGAIIGKRISLIFESETLLKLKSVSASGEQTNGAHVHAKNADGAEIPVSVVMSEAVDESRKVISHIYILRDQREAARQDEALQERIHALESFAYSVSHDLRAPLRRIINYSEILQEDHFKSLSEDVQRIVLRMSKNTQKMSELIDDLLTLSRLGQHQITTTSIDMNVLVRSIIEEEKAQSDTHHVTFKLKELHDLTADRSLIKTVFANLIDNAVKYSRPKGQAEVEIGSEDKGDYILYYVKDTGVGFDMQYAHKLFNVFQRLHNPTAFEGNGVGLAAVHQIVTRHHGKVWADSRVNEGATFWLSLPK